MGTSVLTEQVLLVFGITVVGISIAIQYTASALTMVFADAP